MLKWDRADSIKFDGSMVRDAAINRFYYINRALKHQG